MSFNVSNLKTIVESKISAIDANTPDIDLVKLAKLADRTEAVRTALDAEIQTRLTAVTASNELLELLVLSKSSDELKVQEGGAGFRLAPINITFPIEVSNSMRPQAERTISLNGKWAIASLVATNLNDNSPLHLLVEVIIDGVQIFKSQFYNAPIHTIFDGQIIGKCTSSFIVKITNDSASQTRSVKITLDARPIL